MTIVCATDFSQPAAGALDVAAAIAARRGDRLLLWHAVQPQMDPYVDVIREDAEMRLAAEAERIRERGVPVDTDLVVGWPDHELPAQMREDTALIVVGARGHSKGTHWLIGSVAERLARVTTVPLLVVRDPRSLRAWLDGTETLNVIVATDLTAVSDFALQRTDVLRELGSCTLELLYVEYPPADYARLGVTGPICVHRPHPLVDDVLTRELERRAGSVAGGEVSTRIAKTLGQTGAIIADEAEEAHAGLVVVGSHQRRALSRVWHASIAHAVLHSAETNVLLVPFHTPDEDVRALEPPAMTTIVAATDASPCGNRAVAWASTLARAGTHVVIVTVVEREEEADERSRELERIKAMLPRISGVRFDTVVAAGNDVAAMICATAERLAADLVIVGRHAGVHLGQLFVGSVAGEVLARSRRPVLLVPDAAEI